MTVTTGEAAKTDPMSTIPKVAARAVEATKIYGRGDAEVRALNGLNIDFPVAKFTAIMGPSGSGKSTLLHCMAGLDRLTSGQVYIGDTELGELKDKNLTLLRREQVGFIFQNYNLVPTLTAIDNIILPLSIAGRKADKAMLDQIIKTTRLTDRLDHLPKALSGGQQQKVAAARALVSRPKIVFADEPTGNLDSKSGTELLVFLRNAVEDFQQTIVMVTHDPVAAAHADRVVFISDGRLVNEITEPTVDRILDVMRPLGD